MCDDVIIRLYNDFGCGGILYGPMEFGAWAGVGCAVSGWGWVG